MKMIYNIERIVIITIILIQVTILKYIVISKAHFVLRLIKFSFPQIKLMEVERS